MSASGERFSSRLGAVMTMIGVAIGLANVWRFPYMMGRYGGSAFLIVYLVCMLLFALPALTAEWALGRAVRRGPLMAFRGALGTRIGSLVGGMVMMTAMVAGSYYVLVIGNIAFTGLFALTRGFAPEQVVHYTGALNATSVQYPVAIVLVGAAMLIVHRGLNAGIARVSLVTVPFFLATVLYLIVNTFRMDGAAEALTEFLSPDFSSMGAQEYFAVLGQCFFSVGLGGTYMLVYGAYLDDTTHLGRTAFATVLGDSGAALSASLFLVPATLVLGVPMTSGPSLVFQTLPQLFYQMPGGEVVGGFFLLALALVALLSYLAALEVVVDGLTSIPALKLRRRRAINLVGMLQMLLILPTAMAPSLIGYLDLIFGSGMQLFGSVLAVIALSWGLGAATVVQQIVPAASAAVARLTVAWLRWVVPAALLIVLGAYMLSLVT
jgi:NSS family neurotransmitter:Na+ symporter